MELPVILACVLAFDSAVYPCYRLQGFPGFLSFIDSIYV